MTIRLILCLEIILIASAGFAQVKLNEVVYRNPHRWQDNYGNYPGWLELFNAGPDINLGGYRVGQVPDYSKAWRLPFVNFPAGAHKLIYTSRRNEPDRFHITTQGIAQYRTVVNEQGPWQYVQGTSEVPPDWMQPSFDDAGWLTSNGSIGFGDGDDQVTIPAWFSVALRTHFTLIDTASIAYLFFNIDYDDAFVLYLNGVEIARRGFFPWQKNIGFFDQAIEKEAQMYQGQLPELILPDMNLVRSLWRQGDNLLAVQVNNAYFGDGDMTIRLWAHVALTQATNSYLNNPAWFQDPQQQAALANWHTDFKIKPGESIYLFDPTGNIVDAHIVPETAPGHAHARSSDGSGGWLLTDTPTPGTTNGSITCCTGYAGPVQLSEPSGQKSGPIAVSAIPTAQQIMRYTIDGSEPTENSLVLDSQQSVQFSQDQVVFRVRAFAAGLLPGTVATAFYFFDTLSTLPVLNITANPADLFDINDGIYMHGPNAQPNFPYFGANFWQDRRVSAHVSYFGPDGSFEQTFGLSINGGWSRGCDQKSFAVVADGDFGPSALVYQLFKQKPHITKHQRFILRNAGNDNNLTHYREVLAQRAALGTHCDGVATDFVSVYINGAYWGVYQLLEPNDESYIKNNFGVDEDNLDIVRLRFSQLEVQVGRIESWLDLFYDMLNQSLSDSAVYQNIINHHLDIDNYVDYLFVGIYHGNKDWLTGSNNVKLWRQRQPASKWRHILWDNDFSFGFETQNILSQLADNILNNDMEHFARKMFDNERFRRDLTNRSCDLLNTLYLPSRVDSIRQSVYNTILPEMPKQLNRWLNSCWVGLTSFEQWQAESTTYVSQFIAERPAQLRQQFIDQFGFVAPYQLTVAVQPQQGGSIRLNTLNLAQFPWSGTYIHGNPVEVVAFPSPGFVFSGWQVGGQMVSTAPTASFDFATATTLTAVFEQVAQVDQVQVYISEINYNNHATHNSSNWVEIVNKENIPIDVGGWTLTHARSNSSYNLPVGIVIPPSGYLVLAEDTTLFRQKYPFVTHVLGPTYLNFNNTSDSIYLRLANHQLVDAVGYRDDGAWPRCADGFGRTLERQTFDHSTGFDVQTWLDGCMWGSPGQAPTPCAQSVVFNEINYKSPEETQAGDWFELLNASPTPLNLTHWGVADKNTTLTKLDIPLTLQPDSLIVLVRDSALFSAVHPNVPFYPIPFSFGLSSGGDYLLLFDDAHRLVLSMFFRNAAPWPDEPNGTGPTLELKSKMLDVNHSNSWEVSCNYGSPARHNDFCTPDSNVVFENGISVYPNPCDSHFYLHTKTAYAYYWELVNALGQIIGSGSDDSGGSLRIYTGNLPPGLYFIKLVPADNSLRVGSATVVVVR